jgi:hypothetical protein
VPSSFSVLFVYTVDRTPWTEDQPVATYTEHKQSERRRTSMPRVGFEPTIPVFHRTKTFRAYIMRPLWSALYCLAMDWQFLPVCSRGPHSRRRILRLFPGRSGTASSTGSAVQVAKGDTARAGGSTGAPGEASAATAGAAEGRSTKEAGAPGASSAGGR